MVGGLMLWLFAGPAGVYLLDFFCSGIQFSLLLSPYLCLISWLYLDLFYGVYISQLIRFSRVCSNVNDFNNRNLFSTAKLLKQAYRNH